VAQRIQRFGVAQTAKFFGVLYALVGLVVLLPVLTIVSMVGADAGQLAGISKGVLILIPILNGICGFIVIAIGCFLYNLVAGWVGGIEIEIGSE
jgi:hypothetical protein